MTDTQTPSLARLLTLNELFNGETHYSVPCYQRHYTWGAPEIHQLLQDLQDALQNSPGSNYYIGTLVVDGGARAGFRETFTGAGPSFDVIDGQQRLTTLVLLFACLQREFGCAVPGGIGMSVLRFALRSAAQDELDAMVSTGLLAPAGSEVQDDVPVNAIRFAYRIIRDQLSYFSRQHKGVEIFQGLADFLRNDVKILRVQLPEKSDPIRYFEIMNSRGEQLEAHEVLKARLLNQLTDHPVSRQRLRKVWDACANMNSYVLSDTLEPAAQSELDKHGAAPSLRHILAMNAGVFPVSDISRENVETLAPIIDFTNFLMHVLSVFLNTENAACDVRVPLDDKKLLTEFDSHLLKSPDPDKIDRFTSVLLRCRYLLDNYIIKRDKRRSAERTDEEHWVLKREENGELRRAFDGGEGDRVAYHRIRMLQAAFQVSSPGKSKKHWLHGALLWLHRQRNPVSAEKYLQHLFSQARAFMFDKYLRDEALGYDEITVKNQCICQAKMAAIDTWPFDERLRYQSIRSNFVFNFLDYLLWLRDGRKEWAKGFEFTSRGSVEHVQPQTDDQNTLERWGEVLHDFGNLCLISHGQNSRLSNSSPLEKRRHLAKEKQSSLKYRIIMDIVGRNGRWDHDDARAHAKEMISLFGYALKSNSPEEFLKIIDFQKAAPA